MRAVESGPAELRGHLEVECQRLPPRIENGKEAAAPAEACQPAIDQDAAPAVEPINAVEEAAPAEAPAEGEEAAIDPVGESDTIKDSGSQTGGESEESGS